MVRLKDDLISGPDRRTDKIILRNTILCRDIDLGGLFIETTVYPQ